MAAPDPETKTTYAKTNWAHYSTGRPAYPPSLTDLIYTFRRTATKSPQWNRLVDVGGGNGVAATNFLPDFNIIHNSDPSPANEDSARAFLTAYASSHSLKPVFEFSQASGEDAWRAVGEGEADMLICATAAHFIDGDGLAQCMARMLRSGGTCAVYSYWMPCFPLQSDEFNRAFEMAFDEIVLQPLWDAGDAAAREKLEEVIERRMSGRGPIDSVPLPAEYFERRTRVYINAGGPDIPFSRVYDRFRPTESDSNSNSKVYGRSRVEDGESVVFYESGVDTQGEGWEFDADRQFITNFFDTIRPEASRGAEKSIRALEVWEKRFDEECAGGVVRIRWPAYIALATRR